MSSRPDHLRTSDSKPPDGSPEAGNRSAGAANAPDESEQAGVRLFGLPVPDLGQRAPAREPMELAVTGFLDELRKGYRPSLGVYLARYPQHAERLKEILPLVAAIESWKTNREIVWARQSLPRSMAMGRLGECRIVREIGRGGMGVVFEAIRESDGRHVAVKLLPGKFSAESQWRQRFESEARMASFLDHPHIVPVYDCGEHEGWCYYVMKLIEGLGLDRVIDLLRLPSGEVYAVDIRRQFALGSAGDATAKQDPAPEADRAAEREKGADDESAAGRVLRRHSWWQVAKIGLQVASALSYAHSRGTLHRDIKPANLLLDADGIVWVADFGMAVPKAALVDERGSQVGGTLPYLAPEQFDGVVDERSDIYSLGVTLYELCALEPAYREASREALVARIRTKRPARLRTICPQIPSALERIVDKAMARDRDDRFRSADEMFQALRAFVIKGAAGRSEGSWREPLWRWFGR